MKTAVQTLWETPGEHSFGDFKNAGQRYLGVDAGAETIKLVEVWREGGTMHIGRCAILEHGKCPGPTLRETLSQWQWDNCNGAAISGRFAAQVNLPRIPIKQAQIRGFQHHFGGSAATVVNIGSHGFSVLEMTDNGMTRFRENSRCSQGTGNFLRQLVERFSLTVEEASGLCAEVSNPAPLSGRCPVILKTDMTHLANKGEDRARILAGLFDAVCENVMALIKPGISPSRVLLTGGVTRSPRVRNVLRKALEHVGMSLLTLDENQGLCLEALGCALIAAENPASVPSLDDLLLPPRELKLEKVPALADSLGMVRRMSALPWAAVNGARRPLVMGFDIGSTGAKAVVLDAASQEMIWESYRQTLGDPVGAAQDLLRQFVAFPAAKYGVVGFGVTGSGREVVGSLLTSCYGKEAVFIVNEIVAHATGALHHDPRVDTIFEIGGQDAKYIRLAEGRIIDCAMNEACSAGTGSFIEEQGRKFSGIQEVKQLGRAALDASAGVSLGQHCSVFMAEVIDEAVAAGIAQSAIISGLYDSIIKNYLNRVKGNRSVGKVIFCQGMPFAADALAAAVARQTGSQVVVPPNPGTVGALGMALLAARELNAAQLMALDGERFLQARVEQKDTFICGSTRGCGGAGNHCRIERLRTLVANQRANFTWGGGCSLHDKGTRKKKLPDQAPDPFREREELCRKLVAPFTVSRGKPRIALADEFMLKGIFPFFAAFFHAAGYDLAILSEANHDVLKRGIQAANVPFCAPMQLFHGLTERMASTGAAWIFVPMLRSVPLSPRQKYSVVCPVVQSAPDVMRWKVPAKSADNQPPRLLSPVIDFTVGNLSSRSFRRACRQMARDLGLSRRQWCEAWRFGVTTQTEFEQASRQIGRRAMEYCREHDIVPVVVLGRNYTIYNPVLNSNVPAILREQGTIGVPADCFPLPDDTPVFRDMYWGYGQNLLRVAHQVRREPGVYALYCSNYSCGPDSFNLHFAAYVMGGKPFAVIETDGHSGDAGTKTRVEAFLHCVEEDRRANPTNALLNDFQSVQFGGWQFQVSRGENKARERMLVPYIGPASDTVAAVFRGLGVPAESLPPPDAECLRIGRRFTSGKECLPMPLTLGSLLQRLDRATSEEQFIYLMPCTSGPCRFGVYNLLNNIVLERLGWRGRVRIWSPNDQGYFDDFPAGTEMLLFAGVVANDFLLQARLDVRPVERVPGAANSLYARFRQELNEIVEIAARGDISLPAALWEVMNGHLFGVADVLRRAGQAFAKLRQSKRLPLVELTGEIYVRSVDFSNDYLSEKLEERGLRVHLASKSEWVHYCGFVASRDFGRNRWTDRCSDFVRHRIQAAAFAVMGPHLGWPTPVTTAQSLAAAEPYVNAKLHGEAVLTVGAPLHEWHRGQIDGVVSVGPLECMPTKIAEAQYHVLAEREGILSLTLNFNGDPVNTAALDNFAFEIKSRLAARRSRLPGILGGRRSVAAIRKTCGTETQTRPDNASTATSV